MFETRSTKCVPHSYVFHSQYVNITVHHRATWSPTTYMPINIFAHTWGQFGFTNEPSVHILGRGKEVGVPGENPHVHGENMLTPHKKVDLLAVRQWR